MRYHLILLTLAILLASCGANRPTVSYTAPDPNAPAQARWHFDGDATGTAPPGTTAFAGTWAVRAEASAPSAPNALCQTGKATFPALALSNTIYADVVVAAQFKPIAGKEDQAAGLIVRVQDGGNYYVLRANALENNVNLYKVVGGNRDVIKEGKAAVQVGQWQELRLEVVGNRLRGSLNGQVVVEMTDETFKAGKVGLWTKADSETCFDSVEVLAR